MARRERPAREKPQADQNQRQLRRNQIILAILSLFLILSLVLSLVTTF